MARKQIINPYLRFFGQKAQGPYANRIAGGTYARSINRGEQLAPDFIAFGADSAGQIKALVKGKGSVTFGRATEATVEDWEGLIRPAKVDEIRFKNARRVENVVNTTSEPKEVDAGVWELTNSSGNATFSGGQLHTEDANDRLTNFFDPELESSTTYVLSVELTLISGDVTGGILISMYDGASVFASATITPTTTPTRFTTSGTTQAGAVSGDQLQIRGRIGTNATIAIDKVQVESVSGQADQNPSEYISVGVVSDHGANVDGVKNFNYENGNTVSSNVVNEAKGDVLATDWGALFEPAATNYSDTDDDLSGGAETVDLTAAGTGDYTLSVSGTAAVTVAAGTAVGTGFGQATAGSDVTFNLSTAGTVTLTLDSGSLDTFEGAAVKQVEKASVSSSFIPASGGGVSRTADDPAPMFDYANWSQAEGTWYVDAWFTALNAGDQNIFSVANVAANVLYEASNDARSTDGTGTAITDGSVLSALDNRYRLVVDFGTNETLEAGARDVQGAGSFVWPSSPPNYDGAFVTNNVINIAFGLSSAIRLRRLVGYRSRKGKQWVEDNL